MSDKEARQAVLNVMNENRKKARHEHEIRMHISQIESNLARADYKISDEQVMQAVDYLQGAGMLKRTQETKTVKMPALRYGTHQSVAPPSFKHTDYFYTLTTRAIDELEGETEYSPQPFSPLQNIQINNSNAPVIVGSNNNVSNNVMIFNQLNELEQAISESPNISVEDRQDTAGDIESLKQQLSKPHPNRGIINLLWKNIGGVADLAGAGSLALEVVKGIAAATGHQIG